MVHIIHFFYYFVDLFPGSRLEMVMNVITGQRQIRSRLYTSQLCVGSERGKQADTLHLDIVIFSSTC